MNALETILLRKSIPLMEEPKPNKQQLKKRKNGVLFMKKFLFSILKLSGSGGSQNG